MAEMEATEKCTETYDKGGGGDCNHGYEKDALDPLELLPKEMWLKLFTFLESDPRDMLNLTETCSLFNCLLEMEKPAYRMQEAFPLFVKWLPRRDVLTCRGICGRVGKTVDVILDNVRRLDDHNNLNLFPRLVPPFYRKPPEGHCSFEWLHFGVFNTIWPFCLGGTKLFTANGNEFQKYLEESRLRQARKRQPGSRAQNPIVGKRVLIFHPKRWTLNVDIENLRAMRMVEDDLQHVNLDDDSDSDNEGDEGGRILIHDMVNPEQFHEMIRLEDDPTINPTNYLVRTLDFLSLYPENIFYLDVSMNTPPEYIENYRLFQKIMGALPNLRCMYRRHYRDDGSNMPTGRKDPIQSELNQLDHYISNGHPLPECPFLEKLQVSQYYLPRPYFREIVSRYGAHIPSLMIELADDPSFGKEQLLGNQKSRKRMRKKGIDVVQLYNFPNLVAFALWMSWRSQPVAMSISAPQLSFLQLTMDHPFLAAKNISPFTQLAQIILHFSSIRKFRLGLKGGFEKEHVATLDNLDIQERHSNLEGLFIICYDPFSNVPLSFFTRLCPKLYEITVHSYVQNEKEELPDEDLSLLRTGRMNESKMWKQSPTLEWVKFEVLGERRIVEYEVEDTKTAKWRADRPTDEEQ